MALAETRKLAAIMFTDIVGFSRQMGADETCTLRLLETHNQVVQQAVAEHHGEVMKTVGDAFLVAFPLFVKKPNNDGPRLRYAYGSCGCFLSTLPQTLPVVMYMSGDLVVCRQFPGQTDTPRWRPDNPSGLST